MYTYKNQNPILELATEFALDIIKYCDTLDDQRKYLMSKQLWRSGTAIGALISEAQNAESRADFIHKLKIASKEGEETLYWLILCKRSANYPTVDEHISKVTRVNKTLSKIISNTKRNSSSKISPNQHTT